MSIMSSARFAERITNDRLLAPLTYTGRWRKFQTGLDSYDGIIVRTVRLDTTAHPPCWAPDDLYIWEEGTTHGESDNGAGASNPQR